MSWYQILIMLLKLIVFFPVTKLNRTNTKSDRVYRLIPAPEFIPHDAFYPMKLQKNYESYKDIHVFKLLAGYFSLQIT